MGACWPLCGATVTLKSTPASAELLTEPVAELTCFELTVTSVRRPTTAEGLTTNTLPLPLDVLIPAIAFPMQVPVCPVHVLLPPASIVQSTWHCTPPVMLPLLSSTHAVVPPPVPYVKLPLLWAKAIPDPSVAIRTASAKTNIDFFILSPLTLWLSIVRGFASRSLT